MNSDEYAENLAGRIDAFNDRIDAVRIKIEALSGSVNTFHWGAGIMLTVLAAAFSWYCSIVNHHDTQINVNTDRILNIMQESGQRAKLNDDRNDLQNRELEELRLKVASQESDIKQLEKADQRLQQH